MNKKIIPLAVLFGILIGWLGFSALAPESSQIESSQSETVKITYITDGDTIKLADKTRIRILSIDAPEKGECYYKEAREALKELVEGKIVRLDRDVSETDLYGRLLRHVILEREGEDNILVADYMVRQGFAIDDSQTPDIRYRQLLSSAREEAKRENRGLWAECEQEEKKSLGERDLGPTDLDCIIKGNISEKSYGKTYLIIGCDNYNRVKIDTRKGESYFCTEKEAQDAGFRKATNCP